MTRSGDKRAPAAKRPRPTKPATDSGPGASPAATFGRFIGTLARLEGRDDNRKEGGR
jgi:hypothetical protein